MRHVGVVRFPRLATFGVRRLRGGHVVRGVLAIQLAVATAVIT
jgi:hypothetical protein